MYLLIFFSIRTIYSSYFFIICINSFIHVTKHLTLIVSSFSLLLSSLFLLSFPFLLFILTFYLPFPFHPFSSLFPSPFFSFLSPSFPHLLFLSFTHFYLSLFLNNSDLDKWKNHPTFWFSSFRSFNHAFLACLLAALLFVFQYKTFAYLISNCIFD